MEREKLKTILLNHYSKDSVKSIFCGRMKPSIEKRIVLNNEFNIPILAWEDIKSYISDNLSSIEDKNQFDLIYFDAFGFPLQPELWSEVIFKKMYDALLPKGTLVTYACRSTIKNAMLSVGFSIEKLPGAPGKREMLRATKNV